VSEGEIAGESYGLKAMLKSRASARCSVKDKRLFDPGGRVGGGDSLELADQVSVLVTSADTSCSCSDDRAASEARGAHLASSSRSDSIGASVERCYGSSVTRCPRISRFC
jgi:hypothetical protein